jgi:hypothetical protein
MKQRLMTSTLLLMAMCLAMGLTASATTTRYVNGVTGGDSNNCLSPATACKTIGHAISLSASGDSIRVAAAIYKENLTIAFTMTITGASATTTIVDGGGAGTVFTISSTSAHVTLSNLTIRNGNVSAGFPRGGGIYNLGTLRITNSAVIRNTVTSQCYELCPVSGGGIYNHVGATLTISDSSITGNLASASCRQGGCGAGGGGIFSGGTLTISNSTLSGNTAHSVFRGGNGGSGGGILNDGTLTINNSTFSSNSALGAGGGIFDPGVATVNNSTFNGNTAPTGGGIWTLSSLTLQNSIVANSPSGGNCSGTMTSKGYNLSSDATCNFSGPGDMNNINPNIGPLQNNGGPTQTMALLPGSPAIDAGNPTGCTDSLGHLLKTDQRGDPRPNIEDTGGCDMGAYERQSD